MLTSSTGRCINLIFRLRAAGSRAVDLYESPWASSVTESPVGSQLPRILSVCFLATTETGSCSSDLSAKAFVLAELIIGLLVLVWFCSIVSISISSEDQIRAVFKDKGASCTKKCEKGYSPRISLLLSTISLCKIDIHKSGKASEFSRSQSIEAIEFSSTLAEAIQNTSCSFFWNTSLSNSCPNLYG